MNPPRAHSMCVLWCAFLRRVYTPTLPPDAVDNIYASAGGGALLLTHSPSWIYFG